jgi:hypothetical protein
VGEAEAVAATAYFDVPSRRLLRDASQVRPVFLPSSPHVTPPFQRRPHCPTCSRHYFNSQDPRCICNWQHPDGRRASGLS